ncbi:MAG: flagellin lysine-N-methylase [Clostridia bacterium]|nr:flagellin lysine-N-methylase [Clostridia bacterium]
MKIYAPDYYKDFCCIADKCMHSCCIGWEIDIDDDTYSCYKSIQGDFGSRLADNIHNVDGQPCFALDEHDRCPFLNHNNLCDIIINLESEKLCQICDDHPRYRNYYSSRTEIGLGLCCEAAAKLILTRDEKMDIIQLEENDDISINDEQEHVFLNLRAKILEIIQNRQRNMDERIHDLCHFLAIQLPQKSHIEWANVFLNLERLDNEWTKKLTTLKKLPSCSMTDFAGLETSAEQLLTYFVYRHTADGLYDGTINERVIFGILSCCMIFAVANSCNKGDMETLLDIARMYSSEIEYSDQNIDKLLNILKQAE